MNSTKERVFDREMLQAILQDVYIDNECECVGQLADISGIDATELDNLMTTDWADCPSPDTVLKLCEIAETTGYNPVYIFDVCGYSREECRQHYGAYKDEDVRFLVHAPHESVKENISEDVFCGRRILDMTSALNLACGRLVKKSAFYPMSDNICYDILGLIPDAISISVVAETPDATENGETVLTLCVDWEFGDKHRYEAKTFLNTYVVKTPKNKLYMTGYSIVMQDVEKYFDLTPSMRKPIIDCTTIYEEKSR